MEPARDLIARQPPALLFVGGTTNPSVSEERVAARFMKPWPRFFQDIMEAIELLDLDGNVKVTSEEERFIVANELGVTSRFIKNICDSVSSALSVTRLRDVFFGDIQSVNLAAPLRILDVTVLRVTNPQSLQRNALRVVAVGELKTWWTIELEQFPITDPEPSLVHLENHIGQLVSYMKRQKLKHGFLSTYEVTVFARRIDDYRIELSPPVLRTAQCPSLRECFVAFCAMASADPEYIEKDDFNDLILSGASSGFQASMRPASNRIFVTQPEPLQYTIGQGTIFIGDGKNAKTAANFVRFLNGDAKTSKAVMEVEWSGRKCVAKCWRPEKVRSYMSEAYVYDQLANRECEGYPFAAPLAYGQIECSSIWPSGYILILSWVDGLPLSELLPQLHPADVNHIKRECRKAVEAFRDIGIWVGDCGKHNILYSRSLCRVTLLDFEVIGECSREHQRYLDAPELVAIFGRSSIVSMNFGG